MSGSMYYCVNCNKMFKANGTGKKIKCSQCSQLLYDMKISSEDYSVLSKEGKEALKALVKDKKTNESVDESKIEKGNTNYNEIKGEYNEKTNLSDNTGKIEGTYKEPEQKTVKGSFFDVEDNLGNKNKGFDSNKENNNKRNSLFDTISNKIPETPLNNIVKNISDSSISDITNKIPISDIKDRFDRKPQSIVNKPEKEKPDTKKLLIVMGALIIVCFLSLILLNVFNKDTHAGDIKIPNEASYYSGKNYEEVVSELEALGFTNVSTQKIEDLVTGWLTKDGEVESVDIGGNKNFTVGNYFTPETGIVVSYHTFPQKNEANKDNEVPEDITSESIDEVNKEECDTTEISEDVNDEAIVEEQEEEENLQDEETILALIGESAYEAYDVAKDMGYTSKYIASNTRMEFTYEIENPDPEYKVNFIVTDVEDLDTVDKSVTFVILSDTMIAEQEANKTQEEQLRAKLDPFDAWLAVEDYGDKYCFAHDVDWKLHWKAGKLAERPEDDDTWFLKAECTLKRGKAEIKSNCEAKVTGTTDNPRVVYFLIYDLQ